MPVSNLGATASWLSAYLLSIVWQHSLHRYLVFGATGNYWKTLMWTYVSYTLSLVLSSVLNYVLADQLSLNHRIAFVLTLLLTGILNFFTLKSAFEAPAATAASPAPSSVTLTTPVKPAVYAHTARKHVS